jgi:hypothetical protein
MRDDLMVLGLLLLLLTIAALTIARVVMARHSRGAELRFELGFRPLFSGDSYQNTTHASAIRSERGLQDHLVVCCRSGARRRAALT